MAIPPPSPRVAGVVTLIVLILAIVVLVAPNPAMVPVVVAGLLASVGVVVNAVVSSHDSDDKRSSPPKDVDPPDVRPTDSTTV